MTSRGSGSPESLIGSTLKTHRTPTENEYLKWEGNPRGPVSSRPLSVPDGGPLFGGESSPAREPSFGRVHKPSRVYTLGDWFTVLRVASRYRSGQRGGPSTKSLPRLTVLRDPTTPVFLTLSTGHRVYRGSFLNPRQLPPSQVPIGFR